MKIEIDGFEGGLREIRVISAPEDCYAVINWGNTYEVCKVVAFKVSIDTTGYVKLVPICQDMEMSYLEAEDEDTVEYIGTKSKCLAEYPPKEAPK